MEAVMVVVVKLLIKRVMSKYDAFSLMVLIPSQRTMKTFTSV